MIYKCAYCKKALSTLDEVCGCLGSLAAIQSTRSKQESLAMENFLQKLQEDIYTTLGCTQGTITKEYIKIVLNTIATFDKKQHDYGSHNIADFGEFGVLVRVNDKVRRLKNLLGRQQKGVPKELILHLVAAIERGEIPDALTTRVKELCNKTEPTNESLDDTWLDIAVYGIIALMCRKGVWK